MEAVGRLAGGVAHDFSNLLTVIQGYLGTRGWLDLNASDPLRRDLSEVQKAAVSAATLTQQLLTFSRKQIIDPQILNVNDVIQRLRPDVEAADRRGRRSPDDGGRRSGPRALRCRPE